MTMRLFPVAGRPLRSKNLRFDDLLFTISSLSFFILNSSFLISLIPVASLTTTVRAKAAALYDTGIEVNENDHILTLITCDRDYHNPDGRLIVMAVEQ